MDRGEIRNFIDDLEHRLYRKFALSYHFDNRVAPLVYQHWWIAGEPYRRQGPINETMMGLLMKVYKKFGRLSEKALRYAEKASA